MAKKAKTSRKRSAQKVLNAYQIAERAANGYNDSDEEAQDDDDLQVHDGVMDASKFLNKKGQEDDFEDEELDSDEALGSDEDYDVLNSKFSQSLRDKEKKKKLMAKQRRQGSKKGDLLSEDDEEESEYDSIDESELVPLSVAWDMDDKDAKGSSRGANKDIQLDDAWDSESSQDEEEDDEDSEESEDESDEAEDSDSDIFNSGDEDENDDIDLANTVSRLQSQIKKPLKERKKLIAETTDENEYNVPTSGGKLSLNDMISAVDSSVSKDAILIDEPTLDQHGNEKSKALNVPLPRNIQQRHDRKVAYNISKEQVSKWQKTIEANLDADHLKFPMNQEALPESNVNTFAADDKPANELESKINELLEQSALADDKKEATFEEIAAAKLSKEDLRKRTNELRMMRELMFRDERRAKRIKKIKSKQFHKIKKKERIRNQALVEGSDMESEPEDHDMKRAEERMGLKHKTKSKWAQQMIKTGLSKDAANRGELEEMLRQGERLRAKQLGYEDGDQSDGGVSDVEREYTKDEKTHEKDEVNKHKLGKGVLAMDFMKAAEDRQRQENIRELEQLRKLENGDDMDEFSNPNTAVNITKNEGRRVYTPNASAMKSEMNAIDEDTKREADLDNAKSLDKKLSKKFTVAGDVQVISNDDAESDHNDAESSNDNSEISNPWITIGEEKAGQKSTKVHTVDKDSSRLSKAAAKIAKASNKKRTASQRERDNEDNIIDLSETLQVQKGNLHDSDGDDDDDEASNGEVRMFRQKNLIKEAFAGDDVVQEFEDEKLQVIEDEGDKEEDVTLPGWGDWAGEGVQKRKKKKFVRKIDGVAQADRRKDKNLKDVIINEKVNKKNLKYQSAQVPYPFETREQYERSLRMPIGQQWTSRETHQKLAMPRVITKQGTVIDPLKAPFQ